MYPALQIHWQRGHDPELQVRDCQGKPPSEQSESEVVKSISLSSFTHAQLHLLLQCNRLSPSKWSGRGPLGRVGSPECAELEAGRLGEWGRLALGLVALGIMATLARILYHRGWAPWRHLGGKAARRHTKLRKDGSCPDTIGASQASDVEL
mmetsp:Transcript_1064/g.3582  ORF Transcript_1064/g.3582 Transcript_1064/m.3582 type:complete len:151 (+) Transcript_1064:225-677(+)